MAYYASLTSLMQLLDDIIMHDRYPDVAISKEIAVKSLHEKLSWLEELLQDYSSKGDAYTNRVEKRIRDVAHRAKVILESKISFQIDSKGIHTAEKFSYSSPDVDKDYWRYPNMRTQIDSEQGIHTTEKFPYHSIGVDRSYPKNIDSEQEFQTIENFPSYSKGVNQSNKKYTNQVKNIFVQKLLFCCRATVYRHKRPEKHVEELQIQGRLQTYAEDLHMVEQEVDSIVKKVAAIKERTKIEELKLKKHDLFDIGASEQATIGNNNMVGFENDLNTIKDQLCGQSSQLRVTAIVGMGGIGKTTLAKNTFEDALIVYHFYVCAWVTISQDYHVNRVLHSMLKSLGLTITESLGEEEEEEALKEKIYKHLKGKRYLIVMDDVWSSEVWGDLKLIFPNDCNGSRIMLTTRSLDVAQDATTSNFIHNMPFLELDESWHLLRVKVFGHEQCPPELQNIGTFIASKCHGLPLSILVIAGILSVSRTELHWRKVAKDMSGILNQADDVVSNVLSLSYYHLPHQLRACFLHLGGFPEDCEINISKLIKLWIAEGILKYSTESERLEKMAERYLRDLAKRNLVIITRKTSDGRLKSCVLHDVLREFCVLRAFHEDFFYGNFTYLLLQKNIVRLVPSVFGYSGKHWYNDDINEADSRLLKVLDIANTRGSPLEHEILKMIHLRYLGLKLESHWHIVSSSISRLRNLQSLIIFCSSIVFPVEIWKMSQLRHLIVYGLGFLPHIPVGGNFHDKKLDNLQTLMTIDGVDFTNEEIQMIPNLRKLKLRSALSHNLIYFSQLEELKLYSVGCTHIPNASYLCSFSFPNNLRKLSLVCCTLRWEDLTVVGSMPNLCVLRLRSNSFVEEEWDPIEGEFQRLKFLLLEDLNLKYWQAESSHFPCLEHLEIKGCPNLVEIPLEIGDIPTLKFIDVFGSEQAEMSAIRIRGEQQSQGNEVLQIITERETFRRTL